MKSQIDTYLIKIKSLELLNSEYNYDSQNRIELIYLIESFVKDVLLKMDANNLNLVDVKKMISHLEEKISSNLDISKKINIRYLPAIIPQIIFSPGESDSERNARNLAIKAIFYMTNGTRYAAESFLS